MLMHLMNRKLVTGMALAFAMMAIAAQAQHYRVDWFKMSGGGGTSTGGVYSVSGTIGQQDAGSMSGGSYALDGGFWGIIGAVQMPGAPYLSVSRTTTNTVLVAWPYPSEGFALQQNGSLGTTNWVGVSNAPVQVGQQWQLIALPPAGNKFYRLSK
jgi:hypothetical protein